MKQNQASQNVNMHIQNRSLKRQINEAVSQSMNQVNRKVSISPTIISTTKNAKSITLLWEYIGKCGNFFLTTGEKRSFGLKITICRKIYISTHTKFNTHYKPLTVPSLRVKTNVPSALYQLTIVSTKFFKTERNMNRSVPLV